MPKSIRVYHIQERDFFALEKMFLRGTDCHSSQLRAGPRAARKIRTCQGATIEFSSTSAIRSDSSAYP